MAFTNYCNIFLKRHKNPCFLAELDSLKIVYQNPAMEELLSNKEDVIGSVFNKIIKNENKIIDESFKFDFDTVKIQTHEVFDKTLNQGFHASHMKIDLNEKSFILINYEPTDSEYSENKYNFETAMSKCIQALQKDSNEKIKALLKILCEYYDADKTYLFKIDRENKKIPCQYNWCRNEKIVFASDLSEILPMEQLLEWYKNRNEVGILEASKKLTSYKKDSLEAQILDKFNVDDIAQCIFENAKGEAIGLIAISNRLNTKGDLRLLQAISSFIERDITKSQMQYTTKQINDIDMLTGFYSRIAYSQRVDELESTPPKSLGVIFANVNGLKKINTEFGYAKGDSYIKKSATYIKNHLDPDFYRIAGDEFIAFVENISKEDFDEKVNHLLTQMKKDNNSDFALGYTWDSGRIDINKLIEDSDTVMYINKQEYYHTSNRSYHDINDTTLSDLLSYLENNEFMIYLQPQVCLKDTSLYGAEALIRRYDKTNEKMVFPDQFISLYEKKSVIRHVDIFVVEQVCKLISQWNKTNQAIPISVNLSRVTLQEFGIVDTIVKICDKYETPRKYLVIEVTERVGLIENNVASSLIVEFKEKGFTISLDDFGCAYSNIVTLAQIEVDEVKLDKSLVDDINNSKKNYILVKNVLTMCNELEGTSTLAEGIEDEKQANILNKLGCHLGQGYHYSRPIPVDDFCYKYINSKESEQ